MRSALRAVTIVVIFVVGAIGSSAQPSSEVASSYTTLAETDQLNTLARKPYDESKFAEAVVPAERALAVHEKALGPSHSVVAQSLNNLALISLASGDGVYGLRRALVLAGTASQVVSLWSVNDAATRELMRDYYGHLASGIGRAEALRQAKRDLMQQPRYAHPFYWATFIPASDWWPLDKRVLSPRTASP